MTTVGPHEEPHRPGLKGHDSPVPPRVRRQTVLRSEPELPPGSYTWGQLLAHAVAVLGDPQLSIAASAGPQREARWMLETISGLGQSTLFAAADELAPASAVGRLIGMLERRVQGEPLQYSLGTWSFRGLELLVDRRVLIPRPETEVVAEVAIEEAVLLGARRSRAAEPWVAGPTRFVAVDLGTGSGALALSLAHELEDAEVWATDVSADALVVARANLAAVGLAAAKVRMEEGSWFAALPDVLRGRIALIVSNPPYVAEGELLPPEVSDYEPHSALVSGPTGLEALTILVEQAGDWLARPGSLVCEMAPHQAEPLTAFARECGYQDVKVRSDLAGRPRTLVARRR